MGRDASKAQYKRLMGYSEDDYAHLMQLGAQVVQAELVFGHGHPTYEAAVAAWKAQQEKMGVR
jgi:hypothetical protein